MTSALAMMISEDDFWGVWGVKHAADDGLFDFDEARGHPVEHVWTIVESGDDMDGNWYAIPGLHYVNRLGYVVTEQPWVDCTLDAIYFADDMDEEDDLADTPCS